MSSGEERCPGCGAAFPLDNGPTHPYIGASAGCWAYYTALLASPRNTALLIDAYALQHHGDGSPQAVQSVAVHALTLHGILVRGMAASQALWIRRRALRRKGVFHKLDPPPLGLAPSLRDASNLDAYVRTVSEVWHREHGETFSEWFDRYVVSDAP
jgi:hypothetical protein